MKYIRTEKGIYEVEKLNLNKIVGNIKYEIIDNKLFKTMYGYESHLYESDILKQADTIEELADEVVYNNQILSEEDRYNEEYLSQLYCFNDVYGAIWTSKGLKYIAKMNEDGELVLI